MIKVAKLLNETDQKIVRFMKNKTSKMLIEDHIIGDFEKDYRSDEINISVQDFSEKQKTDSFCSKKEVQSQRLSVESRLLR